VIKLCGQMLYKLLLNNYLTLFVNNLLADVRYQQRSNFITFVYMSRNYKFHNAEGTYFISFAVVGWIDVFARNEYKDIIIDSLRYCQKEKGMEIFAWSIMTNHIHLIFRSVNEQKAELLIGDFKRFTGKAIVQAIIDNPKETPSTASL